MFLLLNLWEISSCFILKKYFEISKNILHHAELDKSTSILFTMTKTLCFDVLILYINISNIFFVFKKTVLHYRYNLGDISLYINCHPDLFCNHLWVEWNNYLFKMELGNLCPVKFIWRIRTERISVWLR